MQIKDKWVVREIRDGVYFTGMNDGFPVLEHLNSRVRTYKSKRSAECAIARIVESGIEYCEFRPEYIELREVQDVPEDPKLQKPIMAEVKDPSDWGTVYACAKPLTLDDETAGKKVKFAEIALCRTVIANKEVFGVKALDGKLYSAGIGGGEAALRRFLEEYYNFLLPRVTMRGDD